MKEKEDNNKIKVLLIDDASHYARDIQGEIDLEFSDYIQSSIVMKNIFLNNPSQFISQVYFSPISPDGLPIIEAIRRHSRIFHTIAVGIKPNHNLGKLFNVGYGDFLSEGYGLDDIRQKLFSSMGFFRTVGRATRQIKRKNETISSLITESGNLKQAIARVIQTRIPIAKDLLEEVAKISVFIAERIETLKEDEIRDIETAAYMAYAGRMFLPDNMVKNPVMSGGIPTDVMAHQVPVSAMNILNGIAGMERVKEILYHLYENYDGTGIPDQAQTWQIPIGARIIRVAMDFEELRLKSGLSSRKAYLKIEPAKKRLYDHRIVALLDQYTAEHGKYDDGIREKAVQLYELDNGMVLSRDIVTNSGLKLMTAGSELRRSVITKIISVNSSDHIIGNIYIKTKVPVKQ